MRHEIVVPKKRAFTLLFRTIWTKWRKRPGGIQIKTCTNKQARWLCWEELQSFITWIERRHNLCLSLSQRLSFCRETEHAIKHDDRSLHVKETWVKSFNSFGCFSGIDLKVPKFFEFWVALLRPSTRNKTRERVSLMDFCPWTLCMKWCWVILGSWISSLPLTRTWMRKVKTGISELVICWK